MAYSSPDLTHTVNRSFPTTSKPTPRRLTLRPEHAAYLTEPLKFTTARFNAGPDAVEKQIITSTGEFVIAWNFKKVKSGQLDAYTIKRYDQAIVQDSFRFNQDREIVVVQAMDVFQESRGMLEKPTRMSLGAAPRSSIVKEWR